MNHIVSATLPNGQRIKLAECDTRDLAELIAAALKSYKPAPVQEEANSPAETHTFKLDTVEVVWKAEKIA